MNVMTPSWQIRLEAPAEAARVEALNAESFGPGRFAKSAYRLREGVEPIASLSFVAVENGILRGSVRFWPITVGGHQELLLGPLAVQGDQRGRGIGIGLMQAGIEAAKAMLERDARPIQAISSEIGYDDVSFFRTLFKRDTGMTPVEYRRLFAPLSVRGHAVPKLN